MDEAGEMGCCVKLDFTKLNQTNNSYVTFVS